MSGFLSGDVNVVKKQEVVKNLLLSTAPPVFDWQI